MATPTVFAQVMALGHREVFRRCVARYDGDAYVKRFSCHDQWLAMAFAQLTHRESLRDLEATLGAHNDLLYQMGFRGPVLRSTLADANEQRDWRIYADWAQALIRRARALYAQDPFALELAQTVYAFDATVIDLCLTLFPWAHFRLQESAIKLHTLLDLRGSIPTVVTLTNATVNEMLLLDTLPIEPGAIYVLDRGYTDFARLARFMASGAFFVIRGKRGLDYTVTARREVDRTCGLRCDQTIQLVGRTSRLRYPAALRRVRYLDPAQNQPLIFLTNLFAVSAFQIAELYRARWQIELFFRWIKQHLCIHRFVGNSENAVRIQLWCAVSTYVLVAILKKTLKLEPSLHHILQVISVSPFEKVPLPELFASKPFAPLQTDLADDSLKLFS